MLGQIVVSVKNCKKSFSGAFWGSKYPQITHIQGGAEVGIHYTDYRQNTFCVLSPCLWFKAMIKSSPVLKYEDLTRIGS